MEQISANRTTARERVAQPDVAGEALCCGRERELATLFSRFELAQGGNAGCVVVVGPSGAGKSTFIREVRRRLAASGALLLAVRCRPGMPVLSPLSTLLDTLLRELCERRLGEPLIADLEAIRQSLRPELSPQSASSQATPSDVSGGARDVFERIDFYDRVGVLLRAVSQRVPLLLIFEDLDRADGASRRFFAHLSTTLCHAPQQSTSFRGLLVASANEKRGLDVAGLRWLDAVEFHQLELGELDRDGVRAYLAAGSVVERVWQQTGGALDRLEALVAGRVSIEGLGELSDPVQRTILEAAAVIGRPAAIETLRAVSGLPYDGLARAVSALVEQRLLEKTVVDGELRVAFVRAGERERVYQQLAAQRRIELHRGFGELLRRRGRDCELEHCAEHLLRGGEIEQGVELALRAGQRLEIGYGYERAAELYELALTCCSAGPVRRRLGERLCAIYESLGQLTPAIKLAQRFVDERPSDLESATRLARLWLRRGDYGRARRALADIRARLTANPPPREISDRLWASLQANIAEVELFGDPQAAWLAAQQGLSIVCQSDAVDIGVRLRLQNALAQLYIERGEYDSARAMVLDNLDRARWRSLADQETLALIQLGQIHLARRAYDLAQQRYQQAARLAESISNHRRLAVCWQHLGVLAERRRDYASAIDFYQRAVTVLKKLGQPSYLAWVALDLGQLYADLADVCRAQAMWQLASKLVDSEPPITTRISLKLLEGRVAQGLGQYAQAEQLLRAAQRLADQHQQSDRALTCALALCRLFCEQNQLTRAQRVLEGRDTSTPTLRLQRALALLKVAFLANDLGAQREQFALAEELNQLLSDPEAAWQLAFFAAELAEQSGQPARARGLRRSALALADAVVQTVPAELRDNLEQQPLRRALSRWANQPCFDDPLPAPVVLVEPRAEAAVPRFDDLVGEHPRLRQMTGLIDRVAATDALVLLHGESGTGKELVADAIHRRSARADRPLVKVNCCALVESLLLSELFGHERGSFTGATQRRIGRFESAQGGTIFLDEIGDISERTQVALLRVLQERVFERVGGTSPVSVDVRIICATNRDLRQLVERGEFREDLYYRLKGVELELPPLRERASDIPLLARHFLDRIAAERGGEAMRLSDAAERLLMGHRWPGNVRELENVLNSASIFAEGQILDLADFSEFPELARASAEPRAALAVTDEVEGAAAFDPLARVYEYLRRSDLSLRDLKRNIENECIYRALDDADGNITHAAQLLGMKRPRLSQVIKEQGISIPRQRIGTCA
ncbi:MAG: sigma 54-interacting transcriptional regulator [Deltaproteobacteria bacterium]|nr:sigma 54-interacting transcriptional regulator [Deltaproteobacteria bacterium]